MRPVTAVAALLCASTSLAQDEATGEASSAPPVPELYTDEQCDSWLAGILEADADGSAGLSEEEFASFLGGIEEPKYIKDYFDGVSPDDSYAKLPWLLKVVHKSLACRCQDLGLGEDCCEFDGAEVPLPSLASELEDTAGDAAREYRADVCNQIAFVFDSVISTPSPVPAPAEEEPVEEVEEETAPAPEEEPAEEDGTEGEEDEEDEPAYVSLKVVGSTIDYSSFDYESAIFGTSEGLVPDFLNAAEITDGADEDDSVLSQFTNGFGSLAVEVAGGMMVSPSRRWGETRGLRARVFGKSDMDIAEEQFDRVMEEEGEVQDAAVEVNDIECPEGLVYAPPNAFCLEFSVKIQPDGSLGPGGMLEFVDELAARINAGDLYSRIKAANPGTAIAGLGNPGDGIPYSSASSRGVDSLSDGTDDEEDSGGGGLPAGGIIGIIIAIIAVPIFILWVSKRHGEEKRAPRDFHGGKATPAVAAAPVSDIEAPRPSLRDPPRSAPAAEKPDDDDESEAPSVWSGDGDGDAKVLETGDAPSPTAGSALAAMGAASAVAAGMASSPKKSDDDSKVQSVRSLVDEVKPGKSAEELLAAYSGREDELISHLSRMKSESEVDALVKELKPGKSTKELMDAYEGREDELISHLETMRETRASESGSGAASTPPAVVGSSEGEWVEITDGAPAGTVETPSGPSTTSEVLSGNPYKDLASSTASVAEEVDALVKELNPGKTAEELMAAYSGREEELVSHLKKLKSSKSGEIV